MVEQKQEERARIDLIQEFWDEPRSGGAIIYSDKDYEHWLIDKLLSERSRHENNMKMLREAQAVQEEQVKLRHEKEREELKEIIHGLIELKDEYLKESENHEKELKEIQDRFCLKSCEMCLSDEIIHFRNKCSSFQRVFGGEK